MRIERSPNAPQRTIAALWQVYYRHGESGKTWRCGTRGSGSLLSGQRRTQLQCCKKLKMLSRLLQCEAPGRTLFSAASLGRKGGGSAHELAVHQKNAELAASALKAEKVHQEEVGSTRRRRELTISINKCMLPLFSNNQDKDGRISKQEIFRVVKEMMT